MQKKMVVIDEQDVIFLRQYNKVSSRLAQIPCNSRMLLYGAGMHTQYLLKIIEDDKYKIRVCDKYKTGVVGTYNIEKPDKEIFRWAEYIVISTYKNQEEIKSILDGFGLSEKCITLYDVDDSNPFYLAEVSMGVNSEINKDIENRNVDVTIKYELWQDTNIAKAYDATVERVFFNAAIKDLYLQYLKKGDTVLDVGAGTGRLSLEIEKAGCKVTAIDTSQAMLDIIKNKSITIKTIKVESNKLPFEDCTFDKIVSCDAMEHFLNWYDFLMEQSRVLKNNGLIIFNMINDTHISIISKNEMERRKYIAADNGWYASVTRQSLEEACKKIGCLELVTMIPYNYFLLNANTFGILSRGEMKRLGNYYNEMCANSNVAEVVRRFEKEIVNKLDPSSTAKNMCVIRKKI